MLLFALACMGSGCGAEPTDNEDETIEAESGDAPGAEAELDEKAAGLEAALAYPRPGGSWSRTCRWSEFSRTPTGALVFRASCRKGDGGYKTSDLLYGICRPWCAYNRNGNLTCGSC